ncbi:hypothetical protein GCM10010885_20960 [Alicyclobacillus cellulosilyticus]|uniref:HTH cro/C1-type domain-containing protein n=1 Tax=Alicyclobacillus cellulosilyticus TaxID=1003997 RepID=A0A917NM90_9BACL|nr:helix-turn-helix transcriptional regulator [Alicyclobacillus cellulosilyticus]GGJ11459.1 hypothetical protein GCM10010885_20960 [Alicyclobacillus cellulosilyticus]
MTIGARISTWRKQRGLSQAQLAKAAGVSASAIAMYETNRRTPDEAVLARIAAALQVSTAELRGEDDVLPPSVTSEGGTTRETDMVRETAAAEPAEATRPEGAVERPAPAADRTGVILAEPPQGERFPITLEEARFIVFLRLHPECIPFVQEYMAATDQQRAQMARTLRLIRAFQGQ